MTLSRRLRQRCGSSRRPARPSAALIFSSVSSAGRCLGVRQGSGLRPCPETGPPVVKQSRGSGCWRRPGSSVPLGPEVLASGRLVGGHP